MCHRIFGNAHLWDRISLQHLLMREAVGGLPLESGMILDQPLYVPYISACKLIKWEVRLTGR